MPNKIKVVCLNCDHSIQLPAEARTTEKIPLLVVCPSCRHVYQYELPQSLTRLRNGHNPHGLWLRFNACECDDSNCKFPVAVYTVFPGKETESELSRGRARWIFHGATCPFGHPLSTARDDTIKQYFDRSA
jgi:hypothetical protein